MGPTPAIPSPAIVVNQHFHYNGEHPLAELAGGEQKVVLDIQTEIKVTEKEMVQGILLGRDLEAQDIVYEVNEDFQDSRDKVLDNKVFK